MSHNARYRVKSLKRPYRDNRFGHTHDRWVVDEYRNGQWLTLFDADYNKKEAKNRIRNYASPGEKIAIKSMDGKLLRVEEA